MKQQIKHFPKIIIGLLMLSACTPGHSDNAYNLNAEVDAALAVAKTQSLTMAETLINRKDELPRTFTDSNLLVTSDAKWWCSGFFAGVLWYLYENTGDTVLEKYAREYTIRVKSEEFRTWDHDGGFIIFSSFGNGYRLTGDTAYSKVILQAAYSLASRFNPNIGCIRSWDKASWNEQWQYPVIIDNMMNLELLMWAGKEFDQPNLRKTAELHACTTLRNHFREDNSSYHVVSYDTNTFDPEIKQTAQGYSDESAWARGQGWGLYGYTMMYRESQDQKYLDQAIKIADFIIHHPNMPTDKIPYWDFNAPDVPNALRDASAGAIICSALLELSTLVPEPKASEYMNVARQQLHSLCSDKYLAKPGQNGNFILMHSVGHMPNKSEVDVPLTYADYYFVEALTRYKKMNQ